MLIKEVTSKREWEEFISRVAPQSLFQSWNWGEVENKVKSSRLNDKYIWRLGIYEGSKLIGIAQAIKVSAKRGRFLHLRHGPILSEWNGKNFSFLHNYLISLGKKEDVHFLRISPLINNTFENIKMLHDFGYRNAPIHQLDGEYCLLLDITKDESSILSQMRKTTRYLIRRAQKLGVKIVKSDKIKDLSEFLDLYNETSQRQHFVRHKGIDLEFEQFVKDGKILLFKGYFQNKLLASALIVFYNNQAIYHHSASVEQKIPVNYLLQWEVIKEAKSRGKSIYNLWGITPSGKKRHPWKGLTVFKTGFGGHMIEYLHAKDYPLTPRYYFTYGIEWLLKVRKGY